MYRVCQKRERHFKHTYKISLDRDYHICGQVSKSHLYRTLPIFDKKLCSERSRDVLHVRILLLGVTHIWRPTVTELPTVKNVIIKCNRFYIIILL